MADSSSISSREPGPSMTVIPAKQFDSWEEFEQHVYSCLLWLQEHHEFEFTQVPHEWAKSLLKYLDEKIPFHTLKGIATCRKTYNKPSGTLRIRVMPTEIHDCVQTWLAHQLTRWLVSGTLTQQEYFLLETRVGTTLELTPGPYSGSVKEPHFFVRPQGRILPTLAVESGWSESHQWLQDDMNLLLVGGNGEIKAVIIVKWAKLSGDRVAGEVELWRNNSQGIPLPQQSETIFPAPATANPPLLAIRRRDLFGPALLPGRNANDILNLEVQRLRDLAIGALRIMGLTPA